MDLPESGAPLLPELPVIQSLVRSRLGYYAIIRLPAAVRAARVADGLRRPAPSSIMAWGSGGTSRFPCEEFPHMRRVFDCAESTVNWRRWLAVMLPSASHNRVGTPESLDFTAQRLACVC